MNMQQQTRHTESQQKQKTQQKCILQFYWDRKRQGNAFENDLIVHQLHSLHRK